LYCLRAMMVSFSVVSGITTALKPSYRTVQFFGSISHHINVAEGITGFDKGETLNF
jgi:hypothetical protein